MVTFAKALLLELGPAQKALALNLEECLQLSGRAVLTEQGLTIAVDVQVHQSHLDARQLPGLAHQPAVHLGLRPVQLAVVGWLPGQVATVGLDLFQPVAARVVTVSTPPHPKAFELALEGNFRLVAGRTPGHYPLVALDALLGGGRRREAQVEVADLGTELAQGTHRHAVAQAASLQRTWQTATGSPCCWQNASQRNWLSCRRSPGPLTSTMR